MRSFVLPCSYVVNCRVIIIMFGLGATKMKWLPLSLDPPPSRPPLSKGSHRERHRDHDRLHGGVRDRIERGSGADRGDRGDRMGVDSAGVAAGYRDGGGHRDGGNKDSHAHRGDRDSYRDHYKGNYYRYGGGVGGHDRDKDRGDQRKGERYNLPPRYSNQSQEYVGLEGGGGYASGVFDASGRGYGGGRGRGGRSKNWRYPPSGSQGLLLLFCFVY